MRTLLGWLSVAAIALAVAVFALFLADSSRLGGDALSGGFEYGAWYVADHGRRTEVPHADWLWNRALGVSVIVLYPLALAGGLYLIFTRLVPWMVFRSDDAVRAAAVRRVEASGPATASERVSGSVGWCSFGGRGLRVEARPGGLLVKPMLCGRFAIETADLIEVTPSARWWNRGLRIEHAARDAASPVVLRCDPASPLAVAITALVPGR